MTSVRRSLSGVLWGLILIGIGSVLLARNVGYEIPIWTGIATWWPLLLVVWGVLKTIDYVRVMRRGESRRLFSPGEVFMVIFILLAGTAASTAANMSPTIVGLLEMADIEIFPVAGDEFSYTQHLELEARSRINVEIVNRYGSIDVLPSEDDSIRVDVQKTVIAANQDDADRLAGLLTFSILEEVPAYRVVSSFRRDSNSVRGRRIRTSLVVRVPRQSSVRIDNRDGYVRVSDLTGGQSIVNAAGNVEVRNLTGDLTVRNSGGEVDVEAVSGSAVVVNAFDAVRIRTVGGDLELSSRNADVQVTGVGGGVEITNSFARTEVSGIAGDLTVRGRNNAVEISDIGGDTDVESSFEDIRIYDARGLIRVDNRNGDIELRFPTQPQGNVTVETEFSEVTFELPLTSSFRADLRTRIGEVETDFALPITTERPEQWTVGVAGQGGPTLRVRTRNGDIRLTGL